MNSATTTSPFNPSPFDERLYLNFFSEERLTVAQPANPTFLSLWTQGAATLAAVGH
jgi:hypothetical protein